MTRELCSTCFGSGEVYQLTQLPISENCLETLVNCANCAGCGFQQVLTRNQLIKVEARLSRAATLAMTAAIKAVEGGFGNQRRVK